MAAGSRVPRRALLTLLLAVPGLIGLSAVSQAQVFNWQVPTAADTFTIGVPHGIYWNGGPGGNVNVFVIDMNTFTNVGYVVLNSPNSGNVVWTIPYSLTPGPYQLYIEDTATSTWTYSQTFYLTSQPVCRTGCAAVKTTQPWVVCGQTAAQADSLARAAALNELQGQCSQGSYIDPSTVVYNVSFISFGAFNCPAGYGGAYAYEASATGCCCVQPLPGVITTWGRIKLLER